MTWISERRLARCHTISDLRDMAERVLPRMVFDTLEGGAGAEETVAENRAAIARVKLVPAAPFDVSRRSLAVDLFGKAAAMPLVIGPTGLASGFWPKGEACLARAAARAGIPFVMSNGSALSPEEVAEAGDGRKWFQLYMPPDREVTKAWLARIGAAGFELVQLTVDGAVPGSRPRDSRHRFSMPLKWSAGKAMQVASKPGWALRMARAGVPVPALKYPPAGSPTVRFNTRGESLRNRFDAALDWDGVRWLRDQWQGPLVVKGLTDPAQVGAAIAAGIDGIVVSNHGGRQLDGSVGTMDVLPDFVSEAGGKLAILIDSGFRSGTDVLKALALGAQAVQLGRATLYGLAIGGEAGVDRALHLLKSELDDALALMGASNPSLLTPERVRRMG